MNYNIFFVVAGFLWGIELIPQIIKTIKTKQVDDFSLFFPCICLLAYMCFFMGCFGAQNRVLFFAHLFPFVNLLILLILILKYRTKKPVIKKYPHIKTLNGIGQLSPNNINKNLKQCKCLRGMCKLSAINRQKVQDKIDLCNDPMNCKNCGRLLSNKGLRTKAGCVWCDEKEASKNC